MRQCPAIIVTGFRKIKFLRLRPKVDTPHQGDQIGRIFAYWAIVYFEQFFITEVDKLPEVLRSVDKMMY
jgi:hypothetical protein